MLFSYLRLISAAINSFNKAKLCTTNLMSTRSKAVKAKEPKSDSDIKPDLSEFKISPRRKLSNKTQKEVKAEASGSTVRKPTKREHIKIEADEESSSKKKNWVPNNWEQVLANIREMRKNYDAPVDSMGCDKCQEESANPEDFRYQALLSLMLSSQTKDQVTYGAMVKLQQHGCSIDNILETSDEKLGELIYPVAFWKTKVKHIKKTTEILKTEYKGDIPKTVTDLCKLPGVGPKMAHLCMQTAWKEVTGIGVDTHVHRICNRLGWVNSKTPEQTRKSLEEWLPREFWVEIGLLLVGFGQQVCQPVRPQCATCLNNSLCPFGIDYVTKGLKTKIKKNS